MNTCKNLVLENKMLRYLKVFFNLKIISEQKIPPLYICLRFGWPKLLGNYWLITLCLSVMLCSTNFKRFFISDFQEQRTEKNSTAQFFIDYFARLGACFERGACGKGESSNNNFNVSPAVLFI